MWELLEVKQAMHTPNKNKAGSLCELPYGESQVCEDRGCLCAVRSS